MDADGSGRRQITFNEFDEDQPGWSPDGRYIVFDRWNVGFDSDVFVIRADGRGEFNLTNEHRASSTASRPGRRTGA